MNVFATILARLRVDQLRALQILCDMRRGTLEEVEERIREEGVEPGLVLSELIGEDLATIAVAGENAGDCQPSWLGFGVFNWWRQVELCRDIASPTEPRQGENGQSRPPGRGEACDHYRAVAFAPGYCWCCAHKKHHKGLDPVQAAKSLLRGAE